MEIEEVSDQEEEQSQVVTVTGGLQLGPAPAVNTQVSKIITKQEFDEKCRILKNLHSRK